MILREFDSYETVIGRMYGGATGSKIAVKFRDKVWMLKSCQNLKLKEYHNVEISYANDPVTEYIGSHIYGLVGIPVHETVLGLYHGKLSVLCSDKAFPNKLYEFREFRNNLMCPDIVQSSSGMSTELSDIFEIIEKFPYLDKESVYTRFWQMFVIDALIGNTDRNNGNWGFLLKDNKFELYDVYDCGACLNNKRSEAQMLEDIKSGRLESIAFNYTFNYRENKKRINPFKFIERHLDNPYIRETLDLINNIDFNDIEKLLNSLRPVITETQENWYCSILRLRYDRLKDLSNKRLSTLKSLL